VDLSFLPGVNASLNALAALLLLTGRALARRGRLDAHRRVMLAAFATSSVFLASYLTHKISRSFEHTTFHAEGAAKTLYLLVLATHVTLAMAVPALAIALIAFGLRDQRRHHRRLARVAWPIWLYVSVTGVLIYLMLYPLNPTPR
jgi:uncharacterized membrane protein YozB (DUF420 family)